MDCSGPIIMYVRVRPQHFVEKAFTDGSEPRKTRQFSPSKVFYYTVDSN